MRSSSCWCLPPWPLLPHQQIDASTIREVATRYLYDKCPAVVGIGEPAITARHACACHHCTACVCLPSLHGMCAPAITARHACACHHCTTCVRLPSLHDMCAPAITARHVCACHHCTACVCLPSLHGMCAPAITARHACARPHNVLCHMLGRNIQVNQHCRGVGGSCMLCQAC